MKKLLVSELTKTIYLANAKPVKGLPDLFEVVGEKQDYTNEAIRAVFEWFMANFKENEPNEAFEVKFGDCPYILQMIKRADHQTEKGGAVTDVPIQLSIFDKEDNQ
jgi:hypothetical protein